jgi:sugar lactone lactonase YvrE
MRRILASSLASVALAGLAAAPGRPAAWDRGHARTFAVLPEGTGGPEGLAVDPEGNVYVASFGFTATGPLGGSAQLLVYSRHGRLVRQVAIAGSSPHPLGLHWRPSTRRLLVADFGASQVLEVDPASGASSVFMTLPAALPDPPRGSSLNDVTEDAAGNVYVSDSFQGVIWRTGPSGGVATAWVDSALLRTSGVPPFGANGLRFDRAGTALFVANTGDDTIVRIPVANGTPGAPAVFLNGVNGADGIAVDPDDNLWVVANQSDEIVVVDPQGRTIAVLGDFDGLGWMGAPRGLLFPASLAFLGNSLLVTNLSLDLRLFNPAFATGDSPWCAQVTRYTVVSLPARLPGRGGHEAGHGKGDGRDGR